ncbi:hypothetical protein [Xanthovirga aplysinae]|uniref:hypothetical protein n=1 Tax=Xanthovirga aplysinae TaxID=2529853 RepID=UPI0012BBB4A5|nr:hypothetical protein [Xanthovirga aplysinae]MTI31342.1 hypothetical protein [Xanthovirga aplysinae]
MKNYTQFITVTATKKDVFFALTQKVEKWWGTVDKTVDQIGDVFKVSFGEAFWTFRVIRLKKFDQISWECIESHQVHKGLDGMEKEWLGTTLHWEIKEKDENLVELSFRHEGLVPSFICYEVCSSAWDFFITQSLKSFLEKGVGLPEIQ